MKFLSFFCIAIFLISTSVDAKAVGLKKGQPSLDSLTIDPQNPTPFDSITATLAGQFNKSGYTFSDQIDVIIENNLISISFYALKPTGGKNSYAPTPFEVVANIGSLSLGIYDITATLFLNGKNVNSISSQFEVAAVPIPAAIWLLLTGLASLIAFRRTPGPVIQTA